MVVRKVMTADPNSYWSNHVPTAEMLLWLTRHQAHGVVPFMVVSGRCPVVPTVLVSDHRWGDMKATSDKQQDKYADWLAACMFLIDAFVGDKIRHYEQCQHLLARSRGPNPGD